MPEHRGAGEGKLKVFISYSRKDASFADELVAGLQVAGFAPFLDKHDIAPGEPWEERLGRLIGTADTVVFVISPDSVVSDRCAWEVAETERLGKRLLPVVWRVVPEADVPDRLKRLNYIFFSEGHSFARSLGDLSKALDTDLEWIREHTRLGDLAARWKALRGGEPLLRGREVDDAEAWLRRHQVGAPEPTSLHREFIAASRNAERVARSRARRGKMVVMGLVATVIGVAVLAYFNALDPTYLEGLYNGVHNRMADANLKPGDVKRDCGSDACPEMVVVPAGSFIMGSPDTEKDRDTDEGPQREVKIARPFMVSKFEVTFAEWDACYYAGGCSFQPIHRPSGRGKRPVINVSWNDIQQYVKWLSSKTGMEYRLLSEAEWEYAARAGTTTRYSWGDAVGEGNANCDACKSQWDNEQTAPVGSFKPNAFGVHDMHGNVWEWVQDCQGGYSKAPNDGSAAPETSNCSRVHRGGAWDMNPAAMRAAFRLWDAPETRYLNIGFRVARTLRP